MCLFLLRLERKWFSMARHQISWRIIEITSNPEFSVFDEKYRGEIMTHLSDLEDLNTTLFSTSSILSSYKKDANLLVMFIRLLILFLELRLILIQLLLIVTQLLMIFIQLSRILNNPLNQLLSLKNRIVGRLGENPTKHFLL